jgi:hypothetical protein
MNHKRYIVRSLIFVLVGVFAAGCAATEAELNSTVAPQTCPTAAPLSCPTNMPLSCPTIPDCPTTAPKQYPSAENNYWRILASSTTINISFDAGEKCTVSSPGSLSKGMHYYQIKIDDQAHAIYTVFFHTLDEGKTLEDLLAYPDTAQEAPSWVHTFRENYVGPGTNSYYYENFPTGQVYISCFISTVDGVLRLLDYGPIEFK